MKLYADTPTRRTRQLLADAFIVLWVVCVTNAFNLVDGIDGLAGLWARA